MIKYRTIVWNEGQRSIPLEWVSCLYKVVRNCAESANSTHPSWRSDAQMEPKCDLNYSPLFRAKVIKRGNNFFFKNRTHIGVFSLLLSHSPGKRGFLWSGNQTFPITSASLLCNLRGNQIWYRDNRGNREADICLGTGHSVPALVHVSPWHQQHGKSGLDQRILRKAFL